MIKIRCIVLILFLYLLAGCDMAEPDIPAVVSVTMNELGSNGEVVQVASLTSSIEMTASIEYSFRKPINFPGASFSIRTDSEAIDQSRVDNQSEPTPVLVVYLFVQKGELPQLVNYSIGLEPGVLDRRGIQGGIFQCGDDQICAGTIHTFLLMNEEGTQNVRFVDSLRTTVFLHSIGGETVLPERFVISAEEHTVRVKMEAMAGADIVLGNVLELPSVNAGDSGHDLFLEASADDPEVIPISMITWIRRESIYEFGVFPGTLNGTPLIEYATKDAPWRMFKANELVRLSLFSIRIPDA